MDEEEDFEAEFRRRVAEARVSTEPDFVFTPWFMRLLLGFSLFIIVVLLAVVVLVLQVQEQVETVRSIVHETQAR